MLQEFTVRDFKSFAHQSARISPFTLLVGANASGKSNFVEALRFLHGLAQGWTIREILSGRVTGGVRVWDGIRGGAHDVVRTGCDRFSLATTWRIMGDGYLHDIEADGSRIWSEGIGNLFAATSLPDPQFPDADLSVEWLQGSNQPQSVRVAATASVICTPLASNHWVSAFRGTLGLMRFLDLQPHAMRDYAEKPAPSERPHLAANGSNVSSVLWTLARDPKVRAELVDWLVELCAPEIEALDFEETESGYVLLRVVERDGTRVTAKSMSDGTLRFLGLLAALKTSQAGTTLVVEDLDQGLHPSRLQLLVEAVESVTDSSGDPARETPVVIATTHSPVLLEAALRRPENSIQLFARTPDTQGSVIRDVRSLPDIDDVLKRRDFAYLVNTGWLERSV